MNPAQPHGTTRVLAGWVQFNGSVTIGFSLSGWRPYSDRWAALNNYAVSVPGMNFPGALHEWLIGLFHANRATTVHIEYRKPRFNVVITLNLASDQHDLLRAVVDDLWQHAKLRPVSWRKGSRQIAKICRTDPLYTRQDALGQWLSGRIQQAVMAIFAAERPRSNGT